ncbi:hypothetical protein QOZ80_6BG0472190 [Eleusine coracana subsp. coracana]|nr:hypothetical protein QOZ80_6BG0472190 [Eleusine coracana subsp. coracana]
MDMSRWRIESIRPVRALDDQDEDTKTALMFAYESLPAPPVTPDAPLAADAADAPDDGVDRMSILPDQIMRDVISRLPVKDAVRTGALASRCRGLWRSVPLVFLDAHLIPGCKENVIWRPGIEDAHGVCNAVSAVLAAHPGPFRCVRITCCYMDTSREEIKDWLQLVADKGVHELAFINRPQPLDLPLPAALFRCTSLTRLHLGDWKFPNTTALPQSAAFPHLKELFLSLIAMKDRDLAFLLGKCPVLEVLTIIASQSDVRLCLVSRNLRCLQLIFSSIGEIVVADAPCLERLFLVDARCGGVGGKMCSRIKIGKAPKLQMLGSLEPERHELEIGNTVIEAGTKVGSSTIVPSIRVLALAVQLEVRKKVKTVPSILKCFPNIETLHIYSLKLNGPTGNVKLKFWQDACPVECIERHVKKFVIHEFKGKKSELASIKFVADRARVLENIVIVFCAEGFSSVNDVNAMLEPLVSGKWASEHVKLSIFMQRGPNPWIVRAATDPSCDDPFYKVPAHD